ncbi:MAG: C39 family peptidase [Pirellulaceae bacterium]
MNTPPLQFVFAGCLLLLASCRTEAAPPARRASVETASVKMASVKIEGVPHVRQKPDFCGEACVEMVLRKLGHAADQDYVFDQSGLDPLQGRGCYTRELKRAVERIGFDVGQAWDGVEAAQADEQLSLHFARLHADLRRGVPSIVCMRCDAQPRTTEHFRLIVGYDAERDEVLYHEPAEDDGAYRRMKRSTLLSLWPLKYDAKRWTVIRLPLDGEKIAAAPRAAAAFTNADYAQHVRRLKAKLPSDSFHVVLEKPFVVIGDESVEMVRRRASGTVRWAVEKLKRDYFDKDPDEILDIWLFKDEESYNKHAEKLFGSKPHTPYGYYSSQHKALVMNISTGGGTLVHEIVHPFMAANFEQCPSWFNEGLASLYEQSRDHDGHIWGSTNWRLRGLQTAIASDRVPPFHTLCGTTTRQFYNDDPGTNYSQARYLCYYLQEHGLLRKFYNEFRSHADDDPGGYETLRRVLGEDDMDAFKKKWEAYVAKLRFP